MNEREGRPATFKVVSEADVKVEAADPEKFTGDVTQAEVLPEMRARGLRGHRFEYQPGARSNWHVHTGEQALVVVEGRGLVQWDGLPQPKMLEPGDWVHVQPGIAHGHGAAADSGFVHLAVTGTGTTEWGDPVADTDYGRR